MPRPASFLKTSDASSRYNCSSSSRLSRSCMRGEDAARGGAGDDVKELVHALAGLPLELLEHLDRHERARAAAVEREDAHAVLWPPAAAEAACQ